MVMDSQALEHLEVLEVRSLGGKVLSKGSLFDHMDNTRTDFGRRLLKRWISAPLTDIESINERLDAVEDLMTHAHAAERFHLKVAKLPDLEKQLSRIYTYSVQQCVKAIYFENVSLNKLKEFHQLL